MNLPEGLLGRDEAKQVMKVRKRNIAILGSTGSIRLRRALDVIARYPERFEALRC